MPQTLLLCAPAPVQDTPTGYRLDVKFVEGMRAHRRGWSGPVHCVLWRGADAIPFGADYTPGDLGFDLTVLDRGVPLPDDVFQGTALVLLSADMREFVALAAAARDAVVPVVAGLEYTLETRIRTLWLDPGLGLARRVLRTARLWRGERAMVETLRRVAGVQFNGFPAYDAHARGLLRPFLYLDNRMTPALMATPDEMVSRADRLRAGAPLRLIHSGRLEPMKGAQDLLPVMRALAALGVDATLDIYGAGSLAADIRAGLDAFDGRVRLHGPVDFETELVPISRTQADVFLSCHRQSDPSCTYLEAMGCGLALVGYANRMWARLSAESRSGQVAPLGKVRALAECLAAWDRDRAALIASAEAGLLYARQHDFPTEFDARMAHLRDCAGRD